MKRRKFIFNTGAIFGLGTGLQMFAGCSTTAVNPKPSASFSIDTTNSAYSALNAVGGVVFTQGVFIVRASQTSYIALSPICTHAGCHVNYDSPSKEFICPCHGGTFDISGKVLGGPPPSDLAQYKVTQNGVMLTISG